MAYKSFFSRPSEKSFLEMFNNFILPDSLAMCKEDVPAVTPAAVRAPHRQTRVFRVASCPLRLVSKTVSIGRYNDLLLSLLSTISLGTLIRSFTFYLNVSTVIIRPLLAMLSFCKTCLFAACIFKPRFLSSYSCHFAIHFITVISIFAHLRLTLGVAASETQSLTRC